LVEEPLEIIFVHPSKGHQDVAAYEAGVR
jgi:hypothetical protein